MPAPNHYKIKLKTMSKRGGVIAEKLPTDIDMLRKKKVPGPGAYKHSSTEMGNSGTYFLSKYINNRYAHIHESSASELQKHQRIKTEVGPGSYDLKGDNFNKSILSKFRNSVSGSFSKS